MPEHPHPSDDGDPAATEPGAEPEAELEAGGPQPIPLPIWAVLTAGVLHLAAVVGQHAFVYYDSGEYETLDFSGRSRRPWAVPLLYELVEDHGARIVVQGVISSLCWGFLALQLAHLARDVRVRWALLLGVLGLSLTTTITNWDTAMLSESLALSLTALILGGLARLVRVPDATSVGIVLLAWVPWIFTRHAHLVAGILATAAVVAVAAVSVARRRAWRTPVVALAAGLTVITLGAGLTYDRSPEILDENLALVIGQRVFPDPARVDWYVDRGMPVPPGAAVGQGVDWRVLLRDDDFQEWVSHDGVRVYAWDLLSHPWRTLTEPLEDALGDRPPYAEQDRPDDVMLAMPDSYGVGRQVIPGFVEDLLWEPGDSGAVMTLLALAVVGTGLAWRRRGPDHRWTLPLVVAVTQVPTLYGIWHASPIELGRHAFPAAVILRIALILQVALLADRLLTDRAPGASAPEPAASAPGPDAETAGPDAASALAPPDGGPVDLVDG